MFVGTGCVGILMAVTDAGEQGGSAKDGNAEQLPSSGGVGGLAGAAAMYTLARLGLVVLVAAIILGIGKLAGVDVPLLVAAVFGVLIALPLGMFLFKSLRVNLNTRIAAYDDERRRRQDDLQSRLRGR